MHGLQNVKYTLNTVTIVMLLAKVVQSVHRCAFELSVIRFVKILTKFVKSAQRQFSRKFFCSESSCSAGHTDEWTYLTPFITAY